MTADRQLVRIEPEDRLVILARTLHANASLSESSLPDRTGFGDICLGHALYQHRSIFQGASSVPAWSHLELTYFRGIAPVQAIRELADARPNDAKLLRVEILTTTPASFVLPQRWQGLADRPGLQASLEYIDVRPLYLGDYRNVMRNYIGPAAARLVASGRFGTFRAMETVAVLHHDPALATDWNQIHLCEVAAEGFEGFGQEFDAALREIMPDGGFTKVFAGLGAMRSIPRWTFNDAVVETDLALRAPTATPSSA